MYNIYAIVILILFDIPRISVNDLQQIQVAAPSPSSRNFFKDSYNAVRLFLNLVQVYIFSMYPMHLNNWYLNLNLLLVVELATFG